MTDDTQNIVAGLRGMLPLTTLYRADMYAPYKAADLIEAQAAEIERLGRELNRAKYGELDFSWAMHHAELDAAKAEIERLRGLLFVALDAIYDTTDELSFWLEASEYLVKAGFDMGETEHAVSHGMGVSMKIRQALALDEMVQAGEADGLLNEKNPGD